MKEDSDDWANRLARWAGNIKLAPGLVGKMSQVAIVVCISLAIISATSSNPYVEGGCLVGIVVVVLFVVHRVLAFATKNPAAALLEGAQFTQHERALMDMKRQRRTRVIVDPTPSREPESPEVLAITDADKPDEEEASPEIESDAKGDARG